MVVTVRLDLWCSGHVTILHYKVVQREECVGILVRLSRWRPLRYSCQLYTRAVRGHNLRQKHDLSIRWKPLTKSLLRTLLTKLWGVHAQPSPPTLQPPSALSTYPSRGAPWSPRGAVHPARLTAVTTPQGAWLGVHALISLARRVEEVDHYGRVEPGPAEAAVLVALGVVGLVRAARVLAMAQARANGRHHPDRSPRRVFASFVDISGARAVP